MIRSVGSLIGLALLLFASICLQAKTAIWNFKQEMLPVLVKGVPGQLKMQNRTSGRFGGGIWVAADQMPIYPLAVAWATKDPANPYFHDPKVLEAIMRGGDALIAAQSKDGQWEFRKKDNSFWGMHYNPWLYSRWIRTFGLIHDAMPPDRRARWEKALTLGFGGIARSSLKVVHNIPSHHAMGLYLAGQVLHRPEWCKQASEFLVRVAQAQDPNGFWSEHYGPVVAYNFAYLDALGIYYAFSHDERVREAIERAIQFHCQFSYPDGTSIETIDERNPYSSTERRPCPAFSLTPQGRAYLKQQWQHLTRTSEATLDVISSMLLYGDEGDVGTLPAQQADSLFVTTDNHAEVIRNGSWCAALSAYACPIDNSRWIQDRQNFVSLYHQKTGLILGGGNTKLQPLWSTFTVGDTKLLKHKPGDKKPDFSEPTGLLHVPSSATLRTNENALMLQYRDINCSVRLTLLSTNKARLTYSVAALKNAPVAAHVTFLPAVGQTWRTASGKSGTLGKASLDLPAAKPGAWFEHHGWRVALPEGSHLTWPALRHNPYRDDGRSEVEDARLVLTLPFSPNRTSFDVDVEILPAK